MSPLKVEKESAAFGRQVFVIPDGERYFLKVSGGRRLNLYGTLIGGGIIDVPNMRDPYNNRVISLSVFNEPITMELKEAGDKDDSRFTFSGILLSL